MANEVTNSENQPAGKKRSPVFFIILVVILLLGGYFGISAYTHSMHHEETDDAQVAANVSPVISKISGYIAEVRVKDNQYVNKGDTLIILDAKDLQLAVKQAETALGTAQSNLAAAHAGTSAVSKNVNTARAAVATANAQIDAAKVNVWRTTQDLQRYENLIKDHSITQQQYELALAAKQSADKQLQILVEQRGQAQAQTGVAGSQVNVSGEQADVAAATIKQKMVEVETAKNNLSYTVIVAHESGVVSKVPVQVGQFIQAGAQLFSVVLSNDKWVIANFKETQLRKMVEGQKVTVTVDAFPKHEFNAALSSFSPATGSQFALLPPDNASGNFVKVVQRLPVRIDFTDKQDSLVKKLRAGMNVNVDVHLN